MDCCTKSEKDCCKKLEKINMKGGKSEMDKRIWLWIIIAVLFLAVLFLTFKVGSIDTAENAVQSAGIATQSSYSSMVGGC